MKKICLLLALSLALARSGMTQKPLPSNIFMKTLPNGLTVLVVEDHSVPLATIEIAVRNGAYTESPEFNGLSHLYEHMFFKGDKDYRNTDAFLEHMQELGISFNGNTSDEKVSYFFTLPSYNLTPGLQLMNSAIQYPYFNKKEIEKENIVVDAEFQRDESNPSFTLVDAMNHHLWGDQYCRKNPIGDHAVIRSATPEQMNIIKNKYYWPNNALLTVAGDVSHDDVFGQVAVIFGSWPPSGIDPFVQYPIPEMQPLEKDDYFIVESPNARTPVILFAWQGPDTRRDVPNTYVADILSFILEQNSSKLHKALIQSGLALQLTCNYRTEKYTGPIQILVVPYPGKVRACLEALREQLEQMDSDDYFTDDQLATAKRLYEIRQVRDRETPSQFAHQLTYWWCSASIDYFNTYQDSLNRVGREDIKSYVRKYIKNRPHCAGLLINPNERQRIDADAFFKPKKPA